METENVSTARFFWVTVLNVLITVVEILGGLFGGGSKQNKKVNKKTPKW